MAVNADRDEDLVRRYREASAELDERPGASARASILAAAAREAGAGPAPAGIKQGPAPAGVKQGPAPAGVKQGPVDAAAYRRSRPRWPLAAAAAVMLSTLAVMLAIRTDEEMPQFSPPAEPARSTVEEGAPASPPAPPAIEQPQRKPNAMDQAAPESRQSTVRSERPAARARREGDGFADVPVETKRATPAPVTVPAPAAAPPPAPANAPVDASPPSPPKTSAKSKQRAEEAEAGAAMQERSMDQAGADARRDAARGAAPAPSPSIAAQSELSKADEPAAAWLERIIKLRREGRHDEAEVELKRFRERYPQIQLPLEALPAAGTR